MLLFGVSVWIMQLRQHAAGDKKQCTLFAQIKRHSTDDTAMIVRAS
jgi:hypothetical protein